MFIFFLPSATFIITVSSARAVALIYIFEYPQPGQENGILMPSTGSAREEDMAIAMSRFS